MKNSSRLISIMAAGLLAFSKITLAQAPNLGSAASFELFTSVGAISNTGISHVTGNVGSNSGLSTGFGNVNGVMHDNDGASALCAADLLLAYNQLNATVPTFFPAPLLGNAQVLNAGVYSISGPSTMNLDLILDAQNNPSAVFIFQIQGSFSANANSRVKLVNGAQACNVFWKIEGLVSMAAGSTMRGTIIANNAAINMNTGDTLEGRALSTAGAITISGTLAYTPIGCGSPVLTGPPAPVLASIACYAIFSSIGPVTNVGVTYVTGDIGSNNGLTTGFNPLFVTGMIHPVPDGSTASCATDLLTVYNYLDLLPYDIELLYPAQFGNNLVLTPHTYLMNAAATFTDTLYLDAQGDPNAVFVIQINGALTTSTYSKVNLINGAQALNVFWKVEGAVSINDYSVFNGSIICNNGAVNLNTGATLNGRVLTTTGAVNTSAVTVIIPPGCPSNSSPTILSQPVNQTVCEGGTATFTVSATGTGLTYQWRKGTVNMVNGGNISGATSPVLTISPVNVTDAAANYNVVVTGTYPPAVTSGNVSLVVNTAPLITSGPVNQSTCPGNSVSFSATVTGTSLTYQWRKGLINLVNGGNISGATSPVLTINPANMSDTSSYYNLVVSGICFPNDTSLNASLMIGSPTIITQPVDQVVCSGNSASFSVTAIGTGLTYQWRKGSINLINGGNIFGATSATLTINPAGVTDVANNYNVIVNGLCPGDTSIDVSLTVNPSPVAIAGSNSPVCAGTNINLTAQTVPGGTYTWTGPNGFTSSLQNPVILSASIADAGIYTLTVTANGCTSSPSTVNVVVTTCTTDLTILKTVDNSTPIIGQTVLFTIVVTNNGPGNATGVQVTDVLQSGYTYVSSTVTTGAFNPGTGVWNIGNMNFPSSETLTVTLTVNASGSYVNTATVYGNETDPNIADNVSIVETYPTDFHIPEGFSPNGDGINDVFFIRGINTYPANTLVIFNRWGDKVFEESPYTNNWDGKTSMGIKMGSDALPVGTYFYLLDLGDGSDVYKGPVYLNK